ncbi:MAG: glycoside hydrolase family 9 protein [Sphaerochaetaceae bacterium]|jgi:endoglucanase
MDSDLSDAVLKMITAQRCGTQLTGDFPHPACHAGRALIWGTDGYLKDCTGGWHDAGDYGRYVVPGAKAVMDLLLSGRADALDEARWELDWMLKMQNSDGGVYHKLTCRDFPGFVMPDQETEELIASPVSTAATADFAGVMAFAASIFHEKRYLVPAMMAYVFLIANPSIIPFFNPEGMVTGEYSDSCDKDERFFASCALYCATSNPYFMKKARSLYDMDFASQGDWDCMGIYGLLCLIHSRKRPDLKWNAKADILSRADELVCIAELNPFKAALSTYRWGSNMEVTDNGCLLMEAFRISGKEKYREYAKKQLDYILGNNAQKMSFITGFGEKSPLHPHHRPSEAMGKPMPGMMVGGPDQHLQDPYALEHFKGLEPCMCYADELASYSTNEVSVYWNASLFRLITMLENNG